MRPGDIRLPGAVDLGALAARSQAAAPGPTSSSPYVLDVTEATFQAEVIERSRQVPVVIDFWATWCGPCRQLSPVLEKLATEANGSWVLAKIDVDANQRIAAAAQVQSIPTVMAVIGGQVMPLFMGALPEAQVRQYVDEVLRVFGEMLSGAVPGEQAEAEAPAGPREDPRYADARAAIDRGDVEGALAAYRAVLEQDPDDPIARSAVVQCELLLRTRGADEQALRARAAADPTDVDAALAVADVDVLRDAVDEAVDRLVGVIRGTSGDDRERVRARLLEIFQVLHPEDPRLARGRRALANALF